MITADQQPIKKVIFLPTYRQDDIEVRHYLSRFKLTVDREYNVFEENWQPGGIGMFYRILDDQNGEVVIRDDYFVNAKQVLVGDIDWNAAPTPGVMPEIRREPVFEEKGWNAFDSVKQEAIQPAPEERKPEPKVCHKINWNSTPWGDDQ